MNVIYMTIPISINPQPIFYIGIEVVTKDQGWASVDGSSSWIEMGVLDS